MRRYVVASHAVLFEPETPRPFAVTARCDVCDSPVDVGSEGAHALPGRGLLLTSRGDERRTEEPALCPTCGTAIVVMAHAAWDIEEEEG